MNLAQRLFKHVIFVGCAWLASVSAGLSEDTLTFTSSPNAYTVSDGDGGSSALPWINLTLSSNLNENWTLESAYGSMALVQSWTSSNFQTSITLESVSMANNFWLKGFFVLEWGASQSATVTVTGYNDGASTGSYTFSPYFSGDWKGTLTTSELLPAVFDNVDKVVFTSNSGGMWLGLNNIVVDRAAAGDVTPPTVTSVSVPANGDYFTGDNLDFTVNMSENVTVNTGGGTPRIPLMIGSRTDYANYLSGSGTSTLVFRYTVQSGDQDLNGIAITAGIDANGGTLRDAANNDATLTLNSVGSTSSVTVNPSPTITSATYDASTGVLVVTATNLQSQAGALNDISVSRLTLTGEGGTTYTLTSSDVEITSAWRCCVTHA